MNTVSQSSLSPLPLKDWSRNLARRWNSASYSLFVLHGNIFDLFPLQTGDTISYVPLKSFLKHRFFPDRSYLLFYDISDGLSFGDADMQRRFFEWLEIYDQVEKTAYHVTGPPRDFTQLIPVLHRFFLKAAEEKELSRGVTLIIDFPEKIIPASEEAGLRLEERKALVTLLKWASSPEFLKLDTGIFLVTETPGELHEDILQNPHIASLAVTLPDQEDRRLFLQTRWEKDPDDPLRPASCEISYADLAARTAGLSLLRIQHLMAEAVNNDTTISSTYVASAKKRLIEEYCLGLVKFKEPKPGVSLDLVATHSEAKKRMRELAWLIKNGRGDVLERGVLLPGRVGVGKSFLVDCFAAECGLPVMEMGEFRSKWVGDTERQLTKILMTIKALGPVIVVVDEADAVFGSRSSSGDSGVSNRVFAALAAHIGDSSLRGRELWIAMTSRPDLLAIDMKRQGRFGLCIPLFPAQNEQDVLNLFTVIARAKKVVLDDEMTAYVAERFGTAALTGSDVEAVIIRAKERAVLAMRDSVTVADMREAVDSFIDPLSPELLELQELAAVLSCSDRRYLPERYQHADKDDLSTRFSHLVHLVPR